MINIHYTSTFYFERNRRQELQCKQANQDMSTVRIMNFIHKTMTTFARLQ